VGVDFMYFQVSGSSVTVSINDISSVSISAPKAATYENKRTISCPDTRTFVKGSI